MLLALSGQRSGTVLNILQSVGQPLTTENYLVQTMDSSKAETPQLRCASCVGRSYCLELGSFLQQGVRSQKSGNQSPEKEGAGKWGLPLKHLQRAKLLHVSSTRSFRNYIGQFPQDTVKGLKSRQWLIQGSQASQLWCGNQNRGLKAPALCSSCPNHTDPWEKRAGNTALKLPLAFKLIERFGK